MEEDSRLRIQYVLGTSDNDLGAANARLSSTDVGILKSLLDGEMITDNLLNISMVQGVVCLLVFLQARSIQSI